MNKVSRAMALAALAAGMAFAATVPEATVSVSTTSVLTGNLSTGRKVLHCDVAATYVSCLVGDTACTATSASVPLAAGEKWEEDVVSGFPKIAFRANSGTGTCYVKAVVR